MSIKIKKLSKVFEDGNRALKGITLEFKKNKITGLIGFNGSGKTTTFNILSTFIEDFEGEFTIDGKEISMDILKKVSYLAAGAEPKNPNRAISHLRYIASLYGVKKTEADKKINEISKRIEFTQFLNKSIKSLSKGNQQKIKVIASLLNPNMEYLFLDEPFDGLDPIMVERIKNIYMELKNVTIIVTSHRMEVVDSMCEEFYVLKNGDLVDSRKTGDKSVILEVNKEVSVMSFKDLEEVISIKEGDGTNLIVLKGIESFKKINSILINDPEYIFSSLKDKQIASSVFEGYGV